MDIGSFYSLLKAGLDEVGITNPGLEARLLLCGSTGFTASDLITQPERAISDKDRIQILECLRRRMAGEPLSRIFGEREFWGLPFIVTPDVLDPRPDTETIVEAALKIFGGEGPGTILDLGTGSGCLVTTLLHLWPQASGVAVDLSAKALEVAQRNAEANEVAGRVSFRQGSWFETVAAGEAFDLIVSNPPYIPGCDIPNLESGVRNHDPLLALDGGKDGFDSYRIIFSGLAAHFSERGMGLFEIGIGQDQEIVRLAADYRLRVESIHPDLAGIPRVVEIVRGDK